MLSIGKLTPARAGYYVDQLPAGGDEYYVRSEHSSAVWMGSACDRLGLDGPVTPEGFRQLLDGLDPRSGGPLGLPRTTDRRVAGFDLCFSAPKSVSVAWALAPPELSEVIAAAHDRAVAAAVETLEREVIRARRGAGGHRLETTGGVAAAAFAHRTSRAGDPQVHTHVVVANLTPDAAGRWTSIYGTPVYRWAKTLGYVYQAELRAGLSRATGMSWGPVRNGTAEIAGIPEPLRLEFSTRRAQIEAALAATGATTAAAAQTATLATRPAKADLGDLASLRAGWADRARSHGCAPDVVADLTGPGCPPTVDLDAVARAGRADRRQLHLRPAPGHPGPRRGGPARRHRRPADRRRRPADGLRPGRHRRRHRPRPGPLQHRRPSRPRTAHRRAQPGDRHPRTRPAPRDRVRPRSRLRRPAHPQRRAAGHGHRRHHRRHHRHGRRRPGRHRQDLRPRRRPRRLAVRRPARHRRRPGRPSRGRAPGRLRHPLHHPRPAPRRPRPARAAAGAWPRAALSSSTRPA